jgi:hypothetical protein
VYARAIESANYNTGAFNVSNGIKTTIDLTKELTSIADIISFLTFVSGGGSADDPIFLSVDIPLGDMTDPNSGWQQLLGAIQTAGKFVALDLSLCAMNGTVFNPDPDIATGKNRIVSIVLPDTAESIPDGNTSTSVFRHFTSLEDVSGENITTIGDFAFRGCTSLTSVSFPAVTSIGINAFRECTSLTSVSFPAVTSIGTYAFGGCTNLTEVSFPLATSIGNYAFWRCTSLTEVSFPLATSIGRSAFEYCTSLTSVSFPLVTSIDHFAFQSCTSLTEASFPLATSIGINAFAHCPALADVTLGTITELNFSTISGFPGNLRDIYFGANGGAGRYTRTPPSTNWTKD